MSFGELMQPPTRKPPSLLLKGCCLHRHMVKPCGKARAAKNVLCCRFGVITCSHHLALPKSKLTVSTKWNSLVNYVILQVGFSWGSGTRSAHTRTIFKQPCSSIRCSSALVVPNTVRDSLNTLWQLKLTRVELHFHKTGLIFISYVRGNLAASCCYQQHRNVKTYIDQASHSIPGYEIGRSCWPLKT